MIISEKQSAIDIVAFGKKCYDSGFLCANDGNLSCRLRDKTILVSPSGLGKHNLKAVDLIVVNEDGARQRGLSRASSEIRLHTLVYKKRPDVNAIIHAHPVYSVLISLAYESKEEVIIDNSILFPKPVAIAPYATPSTFAVPESIENLIEKYDSIILTRHGTITCGESMKEAYDKLGFLEECCKRWYEMRKSGKW
ncbi:MAG: class II aldolase/adducin family protein [Pseudomonadota bacterium]